MNVALGLSLSIAFFMGFLALYFTDMLKRDVRAKNGEFDGHFRALYGRIEDFEKETDRKVGVEATNVTLLESKFNKALDEMNDEIFTLKSALASLGQKKARKKKKSPRRK